MGSGKTQAAITYMNEHPRERFIYITPFLDEASRISHACPQLHFEEPAQLERYKKSKVVHTATLIEEGRNIATTHAAFLGYDDEMIDGIKKHGYTLIIDEDMEIVEIETMTTGDFEYLMHYGYIEERGGYIVRTGKQADIAAFSRILSFIENRKIQVCEYDDDSSRTVLFYWTIPEALLTNFEEVFILTYLFKGQKLHHYLKLCCLPYEMIGVKTCDEWTGYRFAEWPGELPGYVDIIQDLIQVYEGDMNDIGEEYYALSASWMKRNQGKAAMEQLRNNLYNWFRNVNRGSRSSDRLWSTLKGSRDKLKSGGYTKGFINYNAKASNKWRTYTILAYALNVFPHYSEQALFRIMGVPLNRDEYALSTMVQWIWRSAIRDGEAVRIYIPSRRMRELLYAWMESFREGV